jgi:ParB-like chromosome segregation protein Spo0J
MQIEKVPVGSLVLDPTNARKHDQKNLEAIKGSLAKFGMQKPIVVTADNVVIAGNGTLEAAKALGWEQIDIHRTVLKGAEAMAYALADNQSGALGSWDEEILKEQIASLASDGWDVGDFGFDLDDFAIGNDLNDTFDDHQNDSKIKLQLIVSFDHEDAQQELFLELRDRGFKVKA